MDNLGFLLTKVSLEIKAALTKRLLPYNVTAPQWAVLKDISAHPEGTTPAKIAERTYSERSTITGVLERLKMKDYVTISKNPNDKRSTLVFTTDLGTKIQKEIELISDDIINEAIHGITEEDKQTTTKVLKQIFKNTNKE